MTNQRSIETILNLTTGEQIEVAELFRDQHAREGEIFKLRTTIEKQIQLNEVEFVCTYCKQPIAIRGRVSHYSGKHFYFTHLYKSDECPIKTQNRFTEEQLRRIKYNGQKESKLHSYLKNLLAYHLELDKHIVSVIVDKVYKEEKISHQWRKPDVLAEHSNIGKIAFELQLSTTFLSVIVGRTIFYHQQGIYLIWVFPNFSLDNDLQKFTQKDVFYNNNTNVYVFDKNAQDASEREGKLILTCYFKIYEVYDERVAESWTQTLINLDEIQYLDDYQMYYFDSEASKLACEDAVKKAIEQRHAKSREEYRRRTLDDIANYLNQYHKFDKLPNEKEHRLIELLQNLHSEVINDRLKLNGENSHVLRKLFFSRGKDNFLRFLCCTDIILKESSCLVQDNRTFFEELLTLENDYEFNHYAACLFRIGYILTETDRLALDSLYNGYFFNESEIERKMLERWSMTLVYSCLSGNRMIFEVVKIKQLLIAILSLKYKLIIGFRFSNMKQVAHYIFDNYEEYSNIYFRAIKVYGYYSTLLNVDRSGKLTQRFYQLERVKRPIYTQYDYIIYTAFPELKEVNKL